MKKVLNPKIIIPVAVVLVLVGMVAYILFAPETWWKPIYIRFDAAEASADNGTTPTTEAEASTHEAPGSTEEGHSAPLPAALDPTHTQPAVTGTQLVMPAIQPGQGIMYELESKVVNLAEPGGLRYLQAGVVLEFHPSVKDYYEAKITEEAASGHSAEGEAVADPFHEAIDAMRPVIDDIATTVLSSKTFNDVATIEGKQILKQELMTNINTALGYQGVINIYFTEFVVQ
ncbi:MAG: hypothetical protein HC875_00285 [Anaerolineales bacterium]|nr:hypothetical protein [Anaerolineales bacterium]